jgi:hypothetical protein
MNFSCNIFLLKSFDGNPIILNINCYLLIWEKITSTKTKQVRSTGNASNLYSGDARFASLTHLFRGFP